MLNGKDKIFLMFREKLTPPERPPILSFENITCLIKLHFEVYDIIFYKRDPVLGDHMTSLVNRDKIYYSLVSVTKKNHNNVGKILKELQSTFT